MEENGRNSEGKGCFLSLSWKTELPLSGFPYGWRRVNSIISKLLPIFKCCFTKFIFFQDLKSNWTRQSFGSFHFSLNDCPKKPLPKENGLFTIHKQLIVRTNREGCIVTRSRFKSDDDEHVSISFVT